MRADRLLSLLMLLQNRGLMTAAELSDALEVSERTIYRDIDALSSAGIPVYGEPGRNGGYALLEGYRTSLTGLTESEIRALFMLSNPAPLADLGLSQDLRAALLKLSAALPSWKSEDERVVRQRFYLDSVWWHQGEPPVPYLQILYKAIWQDHKIKISYPMVASVEISQEVAPYGLVAKAGVWYLIYERIGKFAAQRVARLTSVQPLGVVFKRQKEFDLEQFWKTWCKDWEGRQNLYPVKASVASELLPLISRQMGADFQSDNSLESGQWMEITLTFESLEAARDRLLAFGGSIQVIEPKALRLSMCDFAEQIVARYRGVE